MTAAKDRRFGYLTITTHTPREVGIEVQRLAAERGISVSACAAALLSEGLRTSLEHQHGALLEAAVDRAVRGALGRIGDLIFRAALDSDETRRLVIALLVHEIGPDLARSMRREAHSASWERLKEPMPEQPERSGAWPAAPSRS